jgi:hypothetical protein
MSEDKNRVAEEFPMIELGGKAYSIKVTLAGLYRAEKAGINPNGRPERGQTVFSMPQIVDLCHFFCGFPGTHDQLAELVYHKRNEFADKFIVALNRCLAAPAPVLWEDPPPLATRTM